MSAPVPKRDVGGAVSRYSALHELANTNSGPAVQPHVDFVHVGAGLILRISARDDCFFSGDVIGCHHLESGRRR